MANHDEKPGAAHAVPWILEAPVRDVSTFQGPILGLQTVKFRQGCVLLQPYDMEVGAGTFHPATFLRAIGPEPWSAAYVQPLAPPH